MCSTSFSRRRFLCDSGTGSVIGNASGTLYGHEYRIIFALNEIENFSENRKSSQFRVSTEPLATSAARAGRTRTARRRPDLFGDFVHSTICRASECRECRLSTVLAAENRQAHNERGGFRLTLLCSGLLRLFPFLACFPQLLLNLLKLPTLFFALRLALPAFSCSHPAGGTTLVNWSQPQNGVSSLCMLRIFRMKLGTR